MQQATRFGALGVTQGTEKRPKDAWADGYAFGFGAAQTCDFEHVVAHGEQSGAIESVLFEPVDFRTGRCLQ
jgi:hypothetical protein